MSRTESVARWLCATYGAKSFGALCADEQEEWLDSAEELLRRIGQNQDRSRRAPQPRAALSTQEGAIAETSRLRVDLREAQRALKKAVAKKDAWALQQVSRGRGARPGHGAPRNEK